MKIIISGLGLIGASLAQAIRKNLSDVAILGYDHPEILDIAIDRGIVDARVETWPEDCNGVDIIFLCTPLSVIEQHLQQLNNVVDQNTIVTDVGSTKAYLTRHVKAMNFSGIYVGGHPMTGAEKSGIGAANPLLFENAIYILTHSEVKEQPMVKGKLYPLLEAIKARTLILEPELHDQVMAVISHLPQIIAIGLMNLVAEKNQDNRPYFELAAGGFRDLTRIASSSYDMWKDILKSNRRNIETVISDFIKFLENYRSGLNNLSGAFAHANQARANVPRHSKGFLAPLTDIMVYVHDQVGVIAKIANALSDGGIDIRDMELLKIREKEGGVFRLSFSSQKEAQEAIRILESIQYQAFIRE